MADRCGSCGANFGTLDKLSGKQLCDGCRETQARAAAARQQALSTWYQHFSAYLADRILTEQEEYALRALQQQLGLTDFDIAPYLPQIHRAKHLGAIAQGRLEPIALPSVLLQPGEVAYFGAMADLREEQQHKVRARVATGGPRGAGKSVSVSGVETAYVSLGPGTFAITNKRWLFTGVRSVSVKLAEVLGVHVFNDGLSVSFEKQKKQWLFAGLDAELAAAILQSAVRFRSP